MFVNIRAFIYMLALREDINHQHSIDIQLEKGTDALKIEDYLKMFCMYCLIKSLDFLKKCFDV